jgi:hypothetical protein
MVLLTSGHLGAGTHETSSRERAKKRVMKHHWVEDTLFFQNLVVLKPEEIRIIIEEIRHFSELWTLVEIKKHFF